MKLALSFKKYNYHFMAKTWVWFLNPQILRLAACFGTELPRAARNKTGFRAKCWPRGRLGRK